LHGPADPAKVGTLKIKSAFPFTGALAGGFRRLFERQGWRHHEVKVLSELAVVETIVATIAAARHW
jgi:hypothetical protein